MTPSESLMIRLPADLFLLNKIATTTEASMARVVDLVVQTHSNSSRSPDREMVGQTILDKED